MSRKEIGTTIVSPSGGTTTLIGRRSEGWQPIALADADEGWLANPPREAYGPLELGELIPAAGDPPFAAPGEPMAIHAGRAVEMSRVVRDDPAGVVLWVPPGGARLVATRPDGGGARSVSLDRRFSAPWVMRERPWRGPGVLRVAPTAVPWSVWWFWEADGSFSGWYVNLELPHQRPADPAHRTARTHTRDLVLDLWLARDDTGDVEVWLKDADELVAAVQQGRYTQRQADGIRAVAQRFCTQILQPWAWPLSEPLDQWRPTPELNAPLPLPDTDLIRRLKAADGPVTGHESL